MRIDALAYHQALVRSYEPHFACVALRYIVTQQWPGTFFVKCIAHFGCYNPGRMSPKSAALSLRISSKLKQNLERVAASEGRSVAQVCEAFLQAGLMGYEKEDSKYVSRFLAIADSQGTKPAK